MFGWIWLGVFLFQFFFIVRMWIMDERERLLSDRTHTYVSVRYKELDSVDEVIIPEIDNEEMRGLLFLAAILSCFPIAGFWLAVAICEMHPWWYSIGRAFFIPESAMDRPTKERRKEPLSLDNLFSKLFGIKS